MRGHGRSAVATRRSGRTAGPARSGNRTDDPIRPDGPYRGSVELRNVQHTVGAEGHAPRLQWRGRRQPPVPTEGVGTLVARRAGPCERAQDALRGHGVEPGPLELREVQRAVLTHGKAEQGLGKVRKPYLRGEAALAAWRCERVTDAVVARHRADETLGPDPTDPGAVCDVQATVPTERHRDRLFEQRLRGWATVAGGADEDGVAIRAEHLPHFTLDSCSRDGRDHTVRSDAANTIVSLVRDVDAPVGSQIDASRGAQPRLRRRPAVAARVRSRRAL